MAFLYLFFFLFRILLLILSNLGFWEIIRRKTRINSYFIPSLTVALQTCALFFAGILNFLLEATVFLGCFGLIYLILIIYKEKNFSFIKNYVNAGFLFLAAVTVLSAIAVRGKMFYNYDDFSHWSLIVRRMLAHNRFPNFQDVIHFKEYPIGSSIFVYYFSRILGSVESIQMTAHAYMMAACILPLFSFCKKNSLSAFLCLLIFTDYFFSYNIGLSSLLVDTLLPIVSACALLYIYQYCFHSSHSPEFYLAGAYLIQISQIKNSGIFFVLIAAVWTLYRAKREHSYRNRMILMLMPFISYFIWHAHCNYVLEGSVLTKHAMHPRYYGSVLIRRTAEEFRTIPLNVFLFMAGYRDMWITLGFMMASGVLIYYFGREYLPLWTKSGFFCAAVFISYQAGLILMYLSSMPYNEAAYLAGIERYEKTIIIFILYSMLPVWLKLLDRERKNATVAYALTASLICLCIAFSALSTGKMIWVWNNDAVTDSEEKKEREWFEKQIKKYSIPDESTYCVLIPEADSGFTFYMGIYLFNTDQITTKTVKDPAQLDNIDSNYIMVYDGNNEIIKDWIRMNYPDQFGNSVIIQNCPVA